MLHNATADGGLGFCGAALPAILPHCYHGPLIVALDSSILIDLQQYGSEILDGEVSVDEPKYAAELDSLGRLIDIWLLRDIRLIVTPRGYTDAKKVTDNFSSRRGPTIRALAQSLAFQFGDWSEEAPSERLCLGAHVDVQGLPESADRDLVEEAVEVGAHIFLTRDAKLIANVRVPDRTLRTCLPSDLVHELDAAHVTHFSGGLCDDPACPYPAFDIPGPDIGKWTGLLSIFE